jgi:hypothetical protein
VLTLERIWRRLPARIFTFGVVLAMGSIVSMASDCEAARSVVIVSIDGLRPDVALRADMPALRSLMRRGSFTMFCATTDVAVTLPSHVSMLTGVRPARHGILYNDDPGPMDRSAPAWPTLFQIAHRAGLTTALSAGKSKFSVLDSPGALDSSFVPPRGHTASDSVVAAVAARWIAKAQPRVMFVHLAGTDITGHASGWGSPEQLAAATTADRALGRILSALAKTKSGDSTLVIVSADHGGAGKSHGGLDARSHFIPWIASGQGVRPNYDLTRDASLQVHTEDTFATACAWLGLPIERGLDGRAVTEILEKPARTSPLSPRPFALVELFTSEGCSSCPPADQLLAQLASDAERSGDQLIALSFHVTYWNQLGWRDRFSDEAFTQRQGDYAKHFALASLYTPQMVVDGRTEFVGSNRAAATSAVKEALARARTASIALAAQPMGRDLVATCHVAHAPAGSVLWVAWADAREESSPDKGENEGRHLSHVQVVRELERVALKAGAYDGLVHLTRPDAVAGSVVAWVQGVDAGPVTAAERVAVGGQ